MRLVRQLAREKRAILLISSEMSVLLAACDRIVVMSDGRIVKEIERRELDPAHVLVSDEAERLLYAERRLLTGDPDGVRHGGLTWGDGSSRARSAERQN